MHILMARPRSEDKQIALLEAATEIVATQGLGAPTAQIAKKAGVAEGTLFRYFATKDDLLNALYSYLTQNISDAIGRQSFDAQAPLHERARALWNAYIDWGIANPAACSALNQLAVSEKIRPDTHAAALKMAPDCRFFTASCDFSALGEAISADFADAILGALAQVTINFGARHPQAVQAYKAAGFALMWRAVAGQQAPPAG
jgi:AcrR family transcriptional regulator